MRPVWMLAVVLMAWTSVARATVDPTVLRGECEYGIALALGGEDARAESAFVSLLSHAPGDARALNNIGAIHLLRGDLDVALAFFARAGDADTTDPGIILNASTALMLRGDVEEAQSLAVEGVRLAGGLPQAALLLGLKAPEAEAPKAAARAQVRKDEVLALLRSATAGIPADSVGSARAAAAGDPAPRDRKKKTVWRSAGVRGAEGTDITAVVYWKQQ